MKNVAPAAVIVFAMLASGPLSAQQAPSSAGPPRRPFPQHISYAPGTIRIDRRTQAQQDDDVRAYYEIWKRDFLVPAGVAADGGTLYRITFGSEDPSRTVSEGQGYGMMIVVQMAGHDPEARTLFDGLWKFARKYPSSIDPRLMSYEVPFDPNNFDSAFDGDCDMAMALVLADAQWGSDQTIDYHSAAQTLIAGILASTIGPNSHLPLLGDWVGTYTDGPFGEYTPRSSDFMPDHFRAFLRATGDPVWSSVIAETQAVITSLQTNYAPQTGLLPDFIVPTSAIDHTPKPAPPRFLEGKDDGDYSFNAGRVPWRLGADALLNNDPVSMDQTRKITRWAREATGGDPYRISEGYHLDGTPLNRNGFTIFFAAPLGVAAMTDPDQQEWLDEIYDSVYSRHEDYYEDSVTLQCLLVMTGNAWTPIAGRRRAVRLP